MTKILGDLEIEKNDSYPLDMWIKDPSTKEGIDLTGYSFEFIVNSVKNFDPSDDAATELFSVNGEVAADQVTDIGKVTFVPSKSGTNNDKGTYYYKILMTFGPGDVYDKTIAEFKFKIT